MNARTACKQHCHVGNFGLKNVSQKKPCFQTALRFTYIKKMSSKRLDTTDLDHVTNRNCVKYICNQKMKPNGMFNHKPATSCSVIQIHEIRTAPLTLKFPLRKDTKLHEKTEYYLSVPSAYFSHYPVSHLITGSLELL